MNNDTNDISEENFSFRTLNYLGSKLRLLDFIDGYAHQVTPRGAMVCDLFAGSGCVSYKLSHHFPVVSCDIQHYASVIARALLDRPHIAEQEVDSFISSINEDPSICLREDFEPLIEFEEQAIKSGDAEALSSIIENGSLEVSIRENRKSILTERQLRVDRTLKEHGARGNVAFIARHYGGVYFSYSQAVQIDMIMSAIRRLPGGINRDVFIAALLSAASDVADTVGKHFAQPIKTRDGKGKIKSLVKNKAQKDKTIDLLELYKKWLAKYIALPRTDHFHSVMQGDFTTCLGNLPATVATVYADPPYTREHYSRFYHVLETIALDDAPQISTTNIRGSSHISNGIYREGRHQSPFCIKSQAPAAFDRLFRKIADGNMNLMLSYSPYDTTKKTHPRVVTIEQLCIWAKKFFRAVEIVSAGRFSHNKLNSAAHQLEASDEAEQLIICTGRR